MSSFRRSSTMESFRFPDLPVEISECIVRLVAKEGYKEIGSLILSGRYGKNMALPTKVLKDIPLDEFLNNPKIANKEKDERSFFLKCVDAKNPDACYIEGIRLVCQDGEPLAGQRVLRRAEPCSFHCKLSMGIFSFFLGQKRRAMRLIREVEESINSFTVMNLYGEQLIEYIGEIRTITKYGLVRIWDPNFYNILPRCLNNPCLFDSRCPHCYMFFLASRVRPWC